MFKNLLNKRYLIFGVSIIATRGLEYAVLFFAAHYLSKESYGELEYYKKLIEVGSSLFAFGFPALIISYTKSKESKQYFFFLAVLFVIFLAVTVLPFIGLFSGLFLLIPFVFYALYFNGGITPAYLLVKEGSNYASIYKMAISLLFYVVIFISIYFFEVTGMAYVVVSYVLFVPASIFIGYQLLNQKLLRTKVLKYWGLFRKLLISSFTLVISNFANLMFLYTDIFILKLVSKKANLEIADFSFALNISSMLLIIPLTLVQVDIEKLKQPGGYFDILNKRIIGLVVLAAIFLVGFYWILTETLFVNFQETRMLFLLILAAKLFHSFSSLPGTNLLIFKRFRENLVVNVGMLILNIVLCYMLYYRLGINGVALASLISLFVRYLILKQLNKKLGFSNRRKKIK